MCMGLHGINLLESNVKLLKCTCFITLNKLCAIEIAADIKITTARAGAKLRAEKGCHYLPAMLGPLALALLAIDQSPTHIVLYSLLVQDC